MSLTRIPKVVGIFSTCCIVATFALGRDTSIKITQDGEAQLLHDQKEDSKNIKRHSVDLQPASTGIKRTIIDDLEVPMSAAELGRTVCEDVAPEHTGFDVHDDTGFVKHASCDDLTSHCHEATVGEQVRVSCPVSCFICTPGTAGGEDTWHGKCFDAVSTGIRFRDGPQASCADLINYCNHTSIGMQVKEACKLSCGLCELHVEGPYLDAYGNCEDLASHEEPEFTVSGQLAGCSDMAQFCQNHPDSYLIRHKCPLTCGVCGNAGDVTTAAPTANDVQIPGDTGGCNRRRRYGFCSTRRRRNI
jgi:hypothetical protein